MRARDAAPAVLSLVWVLVAAAPAGATPLHLDSGHPSVAPSPPADEHAGHVMPTPVPPAQDHDDQDHDEHTDTGKPAQEQERPLRVVLGVFGGVNGAVVLAAGVLRRRDRARRIARQELRSRRRRVPAPPPGGDP